MEPIVITFEQWQGLRAFGRGIRTVCAELMKAKPGPTTDQGDEPYSPARLANTIDVLADMLNKGLDQLSPQWSSDFARQAEAGPEARGRRRNSKEVLAEAGIIRDGTEIVVDPTRLPLDAKPSSEAFRAVVTRRGRKVSWMGRETSLSAATTELRDKFGVVVNSDQVNGFKYWCLATDPSRTLWELAEENS